MTGSMCRVPSARAVMTSSISSLNRKEPLRSSSRVMAREIRTGCGSAGQQTDHHHGPAAGGALDGGGQAVVAAGGFDHDVGLHGRDRLRVTGRQHLVRSDGLGDLQRFGVHVDGGDPGRAGPLQHRDGQRADGSGPDHQGGLARDVPGPGHGVPGHGRRVRSAPRCAGPGSPAGPAASAPAGSRTG